SWFERAASGPGTPRERMMALAQAYCRFVREKPVTFRVIPVVHSPTVLEKVTPRRLAAMEASRGRCTATCSGLVRDAIERGDLVLPAGTRPEYVSLALWALMFGAFMLAELHRPSGLLGIDDPTDAVLAAWIAQMDGLDWKPLSASSRSRAKSAGRGTS